MIGPNHFLVPDTLPGSADGVNQSSRGRSYERVLETVYPYLRIGRQGLARLIRAGLDNLNGEVQYREWSEEAEMRVALNVNGLVGSR